jgi:hypothetical protein
MARVFERPRYTNQARNKVIALAMATKSDRIIQSVANIFSLPSDTRESLLLDYDHLAELSLDVANDPVTLPELDTNLEQYLLDSSIGTIVSSARLHMNPAAGKIMCDLVETYITNRPEAVYCDERAIFYLVNAAIKDQGMYPEDGNSKAAFVAARMCVELQALGQKIAPGALHAVLNATNYHGNFHPDIMKFDQWVSAAEDVQYRSQPMWVKYCRLAAMELTPRRSHVRDMITKVNDSEATERHKCKGIGRVSHESTAYNYAGVVFIYHEGNLLVLDASAADYFRVCTTALRNAAMAFNMFRLTGDPTGYEVMSDFRLALRHISAMISELKDARFVARHMHLCYTRWQNSVGEEGAPTNCGHAERDGPLHEECTAIYPYNDTWWDFVVSRQVPERIKAEFFKLYHLLPPPDIDPLLLHNSFIDRTSSENSCNKEEVVLFINFCKAYDLARYVSKTHQDPPVRADRGYVVVDEPWYRQCKGGKLAMPPRADWGKAQLSGAFPYDHSGDFHVLSAKDSTRVVADLAKYMDRAESRNLSREEQNELLNAIFNGSTLSNGMTMPDWRAKVFARELTDSDAIIAAEAGKAENTKPGAKVRETLSACDTVREFLTEVDHSLRPLAAQTPGVSIRVDLVRHKRKFQSMAAEVSHDSPRNAIATSTDVSGWSPKMPRHMFHAWQDYALSTTECPNPAAVRDIWARLEVFVDRRGIKSSAGLKGGNVQGWPATSDTTLHAHILLYWAYQLREKGILNRKELAYTLCLIDDAATVVALDAGPAEAYDKAKRARDLLRDVYKDLGFTMDSVKSFFSSVKFVYLNELYWDGSQVCHATKTMMRIDKDHTRRFASLPEKVAAAQGVSASAAAQGADPVVAYWMSAWLAYRWAYLICPDLMKLPHDAQAMIMMAPVGMNGAGLRPIVSTFSTGVTDPLTWYVEIFYQYVAAVKNPASSSYLSAILNQKAGTPSAKAVFCTPFGYTVESHRSASSAIREKFRAAARDKGLAEPFLSLDAVESGKGYEEAIEHVLSCGNFEAGLLEEVAANMPHSFIDEVLGRIDKSELIATMLGSRGIGTLRRVVAAYDKSNLDNIYAEVTANTGLDCSAADTLGIIGSYKFARGMREAYITSGGYKVLNHTYPCPFSLWAFQGEVDLSSQRARELTTASFDVNRLKRTAGTGKANLYDSKLIRIGFKGYRTAGSAVFDEVRVSMYNPVRRKVAAGLAALRWAHSRGAHSSPLRDLFIYSWGGHFDTTLVDLPGKEIDASAKRISLRHTKTNHLIMAYPNTQGCVSVDARAISRAQAGAHHLYDVMAAITALRCAMLIEASLQIKLGTGRFAYGFAYKPESAAIMQVPDDVCEMADPEMIRRVTPFGSIPGPLQTSAQVVTSAASMAEVCRTYLAAGARAAQAAFNQLVEDGAIGQDVADAFDQQTEAVRVVRSAMTYGEAARGAVHLFMADVKKKYESGAVRADDPRGHRPENIADTTAAMSVHAASRATGDAFAGEKSRALAGGASILSYLIFKHHKAHAIEELLESDEWAKDGHKALISSADVSTIVKSAYDISQGVDVAESVAQILFAMRMPGFRSALSRGGIDDELLVPALLEHSVESFVGRADSTLGWLDKLGSSLSMLTHTSSAGFSDTRTAGERVPARAAAGVLKAQWQFSAAKYRNRADAWMKTGARGYEVADLNNKAMFLDVACKCLRPTGGMTLSKLYNEVVNRFITTCIRHLERAGEAKCEEFCEEIEAEDLEDADCYESIEDVTAAIRRIGAIAKEHGSDIDSLLASASARKVISWVEADVAGNHRHMELRSAGSHARHVPAPEAAPEPGQALDLFGATTTQPIDLFSAPAVPVAAPIDSLLGEAKPSGGLFSGELIAGMGQTIGGIGGMADTGLSVYDCRPELVFQWLTDENLINTRMAAEHGAITLTSWYAAVSKDLEAWTSFVEGLDVEFDTDAIMDIEICMYPEADFEVDGSAWVNE